ncbi:MAG TPA: hypothetical protein VK067_05155 [Pseudogracilibacillus sp.]|nr:hypothetical protein [Pseudogracilibacillus sp.]
MGYLVLFLVGFGLAVSGGISIIGYLNFLPAGITWMEYFLFIRTRIECYFLPVGFICMMISLHKIPTHKINL